MAGLSGAALYGRADPLVAYRAAGVLVAAALVGLTAWWGARAAGAAGGAAAGLACLLMPRLFAHAHFAGTDVLLSLLILGAFAWAGETARAPMAGSGALWGLALATKFSATVPFVGFVVWLALFRRDRLRRLPVFLATAAVAFAAVNPVLWADPLGGVADYLRQGLGRRGIAMAQLPTLYFGRLYTFRPPWHYAPVMLALTTPLATLALAGLGAAAGVRHPRRRPVAAAGLLVTLSFLGALALPRAPLHDDVRLFLPVLPFVALLAGLGAAALLEAARRSLPAASRPLRVATPALLTLAVLEAALAHARLHPYQASYFNAAVGGLPGAAARGLEVTTMKEVLNREAYADLNRLLPPSPLLDGGPFLFEDLAFARDVAGWLRPDVRLVPPPPKGAPPDVPPRADYVLVVNRGGWLRPADRALLAFAEPTYAVRASGVPLLALYRLR